MKDKNSVCESGKHFQEIERKQKPENEKAKEGVGYRDRFSHECVGLVFKGG